MLQRWNVCSIDGLRVVCYQAGTFPLFAQLHVCMIVAVPCLWPSCMAVHGRRACGRGVVAVITAVPCPPWPSVMSWLWP